ncbi:DUF3089 domain-containing protein [Sphingomonas sp. URHD0057]|uniref:DUF3089 domain-containing protein n=1 Tax=Sphingomonas sp. URHD0057 TaxID=1380389 RepID=UPI00048C84A3|nr:DUF3089 domain-containing protein [Sphingomonas sp. URHD0057]
MRSAIAAAAAAALGLAAPAPISAQAPSAAPNYAQDSSWLCLPGRKDVCSTPLPTTALNANGYGSVGRNEVAKNPPVDCFYVYPTVSNDPGLNSDMMPGPEEKVTAETQFARFASVCRTFAPVYRQMTLASIATYSTGGDIRPNVLIAYRDVLAAWKNYLATRNHGRPFVLVGHSQGSLLLQQLIAREIEKDPVIAGRMKLAILAGWNVIVPQGKLVGGTFKSTPLCSREGETGCVIAWSSFREKNVPPRGAMFGVARQPGMTVGCVNPARPGSRDWMPLDSYWYTRSTLPVPDGPIVWSSEGSPGTSYVRTEGLVSAKCMSDGNRGYLSVRTNADPKDKRTDRVGGEVAILGMFLPGWGMHLADIEIALGDLIRQVGAISDQSRTAARH